MLLFLIIGQSGCWLQWAALQSPAGNRTRSPRAAATLQIITQTHGRQQRHTYSETRENNSKRMFHVNVWSSDVAAGWRNPHEPVTQFNLRRRGWRFHVWQHIHVRAAVNEYDRNLSEDVVLRTDCLTPPCSLQQLREALVIRSTCTHCTHIYTHMHTWT